MPTLTVAGHSVTVGDEFLKLSPEEQNSTVDEIAKSLPAEKPSGVGAGMMHGISEAASGIASTLGLAGIKSDTLNNVAEHAAPKDYKSAPLIREGGHFYNPSDWQPGNIPQFAAELAPGMASDIAAGKVGATIGNKVAGVRGGVIGGLGAGLGSMALRTFGPGAHENAAARTGDVNAPVTGSDMGREAIKQGLMAVPNAAGLNRFLPGVGGTALKKYMTTIGTEAAAGGGRDAVGQAVTNVGQEHGKEYDPNRTAEAIVGGGVLGGTLAAPKLAGDTASNIHFRNSERTPEAKAGSEALATRILDAAGGKPLMSATGNTEVGATSYANAHAAVHRELAASSKGETLSTDNANTLARINEGGKVSDAALKALSTEASPETMHLAHQAIESARLKGMGNVTDKKFTGGISGSMESLAPISNPVKTLGAAGLVAAGVGHTAGLGLLGTYGLPVIGAIGGTYLGARAIDKMTGLRSPVQGFTDRYGGTDTPVRAQEPPATPAAPVTTSVPQMAPPQNTALWGSPMAPEAPQPTTRATLNTNAKLEEGMAKIAKKLGDEKRKSMIADTMPALAALAKTRQAPVTTDEPAPAPEAPDLSPTALTMLKAKLKAGLPPEAAQAPVAPAEAPAPPPVVISPIARKMLEQKLKAGLPAETPVPPAPVAAPVPPAAPNINSVALKMTQARMKAGLPPEPAPALPAAPEPPQINPTALKMVQAKMKQGLPDAPASPAIAAAMQTVAAHNAGPDAPAPAAPPVISKIMKKAGKPVEAQQAPAEENAYTPMDAEQLWGRGLHDEAFAQADAVKLPDLKYPERYMEGIIRDRKLRRNTIGDVLGDETGPDATHAVDLLEELHHTRRADKAQGAIEHFTAKMSPGMKAAMRSRLGKGFVNSMWKK